MFNHVEAWNEPTEIIKSLPAERSEMSSSEQGFLCGLLRDKRPKKVLEVGVAAGGTSCVIMEALERICVEEGTEAVFHSVDLNERYYRDIQRPTGFLINSMSGRCPHVRHETHYGAMLPTYIEEIGDGIDFLILDTAHTLPGEILDFLLVLPYLRKNATVVLHDIMMPLLGDNPMSCATNTLFGSVRGTKFLATNNICAGGVDNIGAFTLTAETVDCVESVFFALLMRWSYALTKEQEELYRRFYSQYYDKECMHLFATAIALNRRADYKDEIKKCYFDNREMERVLQHWRTAQVKVVIYGIGHFGQVFLNYAQEELLTVDALAITDGEPMHKVKGCELHIYELSELPYKPEECMIIIAVQAQQVRASIEKELRYRGYFRIL